MAKEEPKEQKPLEVELHQVGEVLIGRILFQDDMKIKRGYGHIFTSDSGFQICSQNAPAFSPGNPNLLNIRGTFYANDCKYFTYLFTSVKAADKYAKELKEAVESFEVTALCSKKRLTPGEIKKIM